MAISEVQKLNDRLEKMGLKNIAVDWTEEGKILLPEEKAKILNESLDAIERGEYDVVEFDD